MLKIKNIKKGKNTTILGLVLVLAGLASVFLTQATWTEALLAIGAGIYLLFEEDPEFKDKKDEKSDCN